MSYKKKTKANFDRQVSLTDYDDKIVFKYVRWRSKGRDNVNCLESLRDGVTLNVLVEEVTGLRIQFDPNPANEKERRENIRVALQFLKKINIDTCKLSATPILKADKRTLLLLENIFKYDILATLYGSTRPEHNMDPYQEFIDWINKRIEPHLQVRNFTDYWVSGKALAALVNSFDSRSLADWRVWSEVEHIQNTRRAMTEAQFLGVSMWITPEEMSSGKANRLHTAVYLFQFLKLPNAIVDMRGTRGRAIVGDYLETTNPLQQVQSEFVQAGPHYVFNPSPARPQTGEYQNDVPGGMASPPFMSPIPHNKWPSARDTGPKLGHPIVRSQHSTPIFDNDYRDGFSRDQLPFSPKTHLIGGSVKQRTSMNDRSRSQYSLGSVRSTFSNWSLRSGSVCSLDSADRQRIQPKEDWFDEQQEALDQPEQSCGELIDRDKHLGQRHTLFTPRTEKGFWLQLPDFERDEYRIALKDFILKGEIRTKREIGRGIQSVVHEVRFAHPGDGYKILAAKSLAGDSVTIQDVMNFLDEARMMVSFKHPRVMTLECLVFSKGKPILLLPLQTNGNLQSYLKSQGPKITSNSLHQFCGDIAEGMAYLHHEANVVHRNLHAVNCLLDKDLRVKVDDFVRARETIELSEYDVVNTEFCKRSWKIQAPENLDPDKPTAHNYKTDVWAYGILLCTIYHYGDDMLTYPKIVDAGALLRFFKDGRVVQKPQAMPDSIYRLVLQCLSMEPLDRPSFDELFKELQVASAAPSPSAAPSAQATTQQHEDDYDKIDESRINPTYWLPAQQIVYKNTAVQGNILEQRASPEYDQT